MSQHYTKATVEAMEWCNVCAKHTVHLVFDGRRGACRECIARREAEKAAREDLPPAAEQISLFERKRQ